MMYNKDLSSCFDIYSAITKSGTATILSGGQSVECNQSIDKRSLLLKTAVNLSLRVVNMDALLADPSLSIVNGYSWYIPSGQAYCSHKSMYHQKGKEAFEKYVIKVAKLQSRDFDAEANSFYRLIFPFSGNKWSWRDLECCSYQAGNYENYNLVKFTIPNKGDVHLFYTSKPFPDTLVVDILFPSTYCEALDIAYNASLTISLITQNVILDYCLAFAYNDDKMTGESERVFQLLAQSSCGQYGIFCNNMFSVHEFLLRPENSAIAYAAQQIVLNDADDKTVVNSDFIPPLKASFINDYFILLLSDNNLQRAVAILLDASSFSLEYEGVMFATALETITTALYTKGPKPVDKTTYSDISTQLKAVISSFEASGKIPSAGAKILINKIDSLNNPPNSEKLSVPFKNIGYVLQPYESKAISDRNQFMHGRLPIHGRTDADFYKLWNTCIILHKLCMILILKTAGYSGLIQNNAIVYKIPEAIAAREEYFQQI